MPRRCGRRRLASSAACALAAACTFLGACRGHGEAELRVVSAREALVVPRHAAIQGRDGGTSGLAFGRSVWAYGDTALEAPD